MICYGLASSQWSISGKGLKTSTVFVGSSPTPSHAKPSRRQVFEPRLPSFLKDLRPSSASSRFIILFFYNILYKSQSANSIKPACLSDLQFQLFF